MAEWTGMSADPAEARVLQPFEEYWLMLGRFVSEFSRLETMLQIYLMREAGIDPEIAPAIFSGARIEVTKSYIKRLREVRGKGESKVLDRIVAQIGVISTVRNNILHYGAKFEVAAKEGVVSNTFMSMPGREIEFPVSPDILGGLCADLHTVTSGLAIVMVEDSPLPTEVVDTLRNAAEAPWRYTPPGPVRTRPRNPTYEQRFEPPPEPSQG